MAYVPPDPRYQYRDVTLGLHVRGTMGGAYEKLASDPRAKNPYHYHRTTADYVYKVVNGGQCRLAWPVGNVSGTNIPATFKTQFAARVSDWHDLTPAEKAAYDVSAKKLGYICGFNYFMSLIQYI